MLLCFDESLRFQNYSAKEIKLEELQNDRGHFEGYFFKILLRNSKILSHDKRPFKSI